MTKKRFFLILTAVVSALLLVAVAAVGASTGWFGLLPGTARPNGETYETLIDPIAEELTALDIDWHSGNVSLSVWDGEKIQITEQAATGALADDERLSVSTSGGTLRIRWMENHLFSLFGAKHAAKQLSVQLPRSMALANLACRSVSGDVTLTGCEAEKLSVGSTSGAVTLQAVTAAALSADTVSGALTLEHTTASGSADVTTTSGEMTLTAFSAPALSFETTSGAVSLSGRVDSLTGSSVSAPLSAELIRCPAELTIQSVSGGVTLTLPENDGFYLDYSTVSGALHSDFPLIGGLAKSGKALYLAGTSRFSVSTTSGEITLKKAS